MSPYLADNDQPPPICLFHCEDEPPVPPYNGNVTLNNEVRDLLYIKITYIIVSQKKQMELEPTQKELQE